MRNLPGKHSDSLMQWMRSFLIGGLSALFSSAVFSQCPFAFDGDATFSAQPNGIAVMHQASRNRGTPAASGTGLSAALSRAQHILPRNQKFDVTANGRVDWHDALAIAHHLTGFYANALRAVISLASPERKVSQFASSNGAACPVAPPAPIDPFTYAGTGTVHLIGNGSGEIYFPTIPNLKCGDTVAIRAGTYDGIAFNAALAGAPGCPVIVRNDGGPVVANVWGLAFVGSKHVILRSNVRGEFGFRVFKGVGASISESARDIDISGVHTSGAFYGFLVKTDPECGKLNHVGPNTFIEDIRIHDNLVENTSYEGMYLGYYEAKPVNVTCNGVTTTVLAQRLSRVSISNNTLRNTNNDGIKLRLCLNGCDVTNNTIIGTGLGHSGSPNVEQVGAWCTGITIGSETYGRIIGNTIKNTYCSAIDVRSNATDGQIEIANNSTSYAGTLPSGVQGPSWAPGIIYVMLAPWQKFHIHDNPHTNHRGPDLIFQNYKPPVPNSVPHPYIGSQCRSNTKPIAYLTDGTMPPVPGC